MGRRLTDRQSEILAMVADGLENKEIGRRLGITEQSVKEHVSALFRRLSVKNRAGLADAAAMLRVLGSTGVDAEWLQMLFLHAPVKVALLEGPEHRFVAVNDRYRRAAGPRELIGLTFREAFPDLDEGGIVSMLDEAYRTGENVSRTEVAAAWYRGDPVTQQPGFLNVMVEPMRRADGEVGGVIFFGMDVTASVEARERERETRDERRAVLEQLPSGVIQISGDGTIVDINAAGRAILGLGPDVEGQQAWQTLKLMDEHGDLLPEAARPLRRALRGDRVETAEYVGIVSATGQEVRLRVSSAPLYDGERRVRGAVVVFTPSGSSTERTSER